MKKSRSSEFDFGSGRSRSSWAYGFSLLLLIFLFFGFSSCDENSSSSGETKKKIEDNVKTSTWRVTNYNDSGTDETNHFTGFNFTFAASGVLTAVKSTTTYTGTWSITDSNSNDDSLNDLHFNINFNLTNEFEDLNDDWDIISQSATKIELRDVSGGGSGTDLLTFEKN
jgi:hypothetical protein